jgi:hypothetical protein
MRAFTAALAFAGLCFAQGGTEPKPKPEDYPVHAGSRGAALGAEFMVHSFSRGEQSFIAQDYLVVEAALFPPKSGEARAGPGAFRLRVNGRKQTLAAVAPQMAAATLQHPEWSERPSVAVSAGPVILGGPPINRQPFPGAPAPPQTRAPRAPDPNAPGGIDRQPPVRAEELLVETALPEGSFKGPVSGFLYFPYKGKVRSIRSLELLWEDAALKLR